jgi:hypothetical protein
MAIPLSPERKAYLLARLHAALFGGRARLDAFDAEYPDERAWHVSDVKRYAPDSFTLAGLLQAKRMP